MSSPKHGHPRPVWQAQPRQENGAWHGPHGLFQFDRAGPWRALLRCLELDGPVHSRLQLPVFRGDEAISACSSVID
jgi:hypothetical protein